MTIEEIIKGKQYTLIDVREAEELETDGKINSAIHIPLADIQDNIEEIAQMQKPIILFCRSGNRSGRAIDFLESEGIENLYNGGGYNDLSKIINQ